MQADGLAGRQTDEKTDQKTDRQTDNFLGIRLPTQCQSVTKLYQLPAILRLFCLISNLVWK
jgi:hypothetical protein